MELQPHTIVFAMDYLTIQELNEIRLKYAEKALWTQNCHGLENKIACRIRDNESVCVSKTLQRCEIPEVMNWNGTCHYVLLKDLLKSKAVFGVTNLLMFYDGPIFGTRVVQLGDVIFYGAICGTELRVYTPNVGFLKFSLGADREASKLFAKNLAAKKVQRAVRAYLWKPFYKSGKIGFYPRSKLEASSIELSRNESCSKPLND